MPKAPTQQPSQGRIQVVGLLPRRRLKTNQSTTATNTFVCIQFCFYCALL